MTRSEKYLNSISRENYLRKKYLAIIPREVHKFVQMLCICKFFRNLFFKQVVTEPDFIVDSGSGYKLVVVSKISKEAWTDQDQKHLKHLWI